MQFPFAPSTLPRVTTLTKTVYVSFCHFFLSPLFTLSGLSRELSVQSVAKLLTVMTFIFFFYCAKKEMESCPRLDEVNQRTFNCQMKRLLQNNEKRNERKETKKKTRASIPSPFLLSSLTLLLL